MLSSIESKEEKIQNLGTDYDYCCSIAEILQGILQIVGNFEENLEANEQLQYFIFSTMKIFEDVKES